MGAEENDLVRKPCWRFCQDTISWNPLPQEVDSALYEFDQAIKDKEVLLGVATDFQLMKNRANGASYFVTICTICCCASPSFSFYGMGEGNKDRYSWLCSTSMKAIAINTRRQEIVTRRLLIRLERIDGTGGVMDSLSRNSCRTKQVVEQLQAWAKAYDGVDAAALYVSCHFYHLKQDFVSEMKVIEGNKTVSFFRIHVI